MEYSFIRDIQKCRYKRIGVEIIFVSFINLTINLMNQTSFDVIFNRFYTFFNALTSEKTNKSLRNIKDHSSKTYG